MTAKGTNSQLTEPQTTFYRLLNSCWWQPCILYNFLFGPDKRTHLYCCSLTKLFSPPLIKQLISQKERQANKQLGGYRKELKWQSFLVK